ncbi:hypothetical protein LCGC14_0459260 [marine sediment metagenome]|uniref:Nudix hydrolase domain-containing protein n=1 Tax=marine sediment metagenome TaxID=412755 RepID=A0A0F9SYD6_9ZZZZ
MNADIILSLSEKFLKLAQSNFGAGILFLCKDDNTILFVRRSSEVDEPGTWGIPGGALEAGEEPSEAAWRETIEELGSRPHRVRLIDTIVKKDKYGEYHIFVVNISADEKTIWTPKITLNHESSEYKWFRLGAMPDNLHSAINIIRT